MEVTDVLYVRRRRWCMEKDTNNLITVSKARKDDKHVITISKARKDDKDDKQLKKMAMTVHKICRCEYIKERNIYKFWEQAAGSSKNELYLKSLAQFDFKSNCFLYGKIYNCCKIKKIFIKHEPVFVYLR